MSIRARVGGVAGLLVVGGIALAGCGAADESEAGSITVFAAASLANAFESIADDFEAATPGARVVFAFAGSTDLAAQLVEGAPADVFAAANEATMATLVDADLADGDPAVFATNVLEIAVPPGNPAGITGLADLDDPGLRLVVCAPAVPCGAATASVASAAGITLRPVSEENSVTDVLGKVASGEADAGLVYATDVLSADGTVEGIPFPESAEAVNRYPIVRVSGAGNPALADAFIALVRGPEGRAALAAAGFGPP